MNKTVTANISGIVFHIETDAYEKLHNYLSTIKKYFRDSDGTEEIMADIEARIAELFKEKLNGSSDVITNAEVHRVVEIMGEPEQYMDEDTAESYSESGHSNESTRSNSNWNSKKLYRDDEGGNIGGVCSGLGYYFGVDSIWIKAAFLISVFGFGTGLLLYLILWIIMPAARTTSEKLEMKGEPINVQNIGNTIKDEFNHFKKKVDDGTGRNFVKSTENGIYKFFDFIGKILVFFLKFFVKLIGILFILIALGGVITFLVFMVGGPFDMAINNFDFGNFWTTNMAEIFFSSKTMFYTGFVGLAIVTIIPLLAILYGGIKILFDIPKSNRTINLTAVSLLILGIIMICVSATTTATEYANEQRVSDTIELEQFKSDTLWLASYGNTYSAYNERLSNIFIENNEIFIDNIRVDVTATNKSKIELKLLKTAKGRIRKDAGRRAENTMIEYKLEDNKLLISPLISVPFNDGFRDQYVRISLALPIGKTVYLEQSSIDIIYDIKNITDEHDYNMIGHYWIMTERGLKCADCVEVIEEDDDDSPGLNTSFKFDKLDDSEDIVIDLNNGKIKVTI